MSVDPRTPVLVGVAAVQQRVDEPGNGLDAVELMAHAAEQAAVDSGARALLGALDEVLIPRGMWGPGDPGRRLADRFGARKARTLVAELGVLQQTLLTRAADSIASGEADVVLVTGAEAAYRERRMRGTGLPAIHQPLPPIEPDVTLRPTGDILHRVEIDRGLPVPVRQYAILESALRHAEGLSVEEHAASLNRLWARVAEPAAANPDAWHRAPVSADMFEASPANPMVSRPYTRSHCSRAGVDQGAALILCSAEAAERHGIPRDRWVFPWAAAESNLMVPIVARAQLHRSPGFAAIGAWLTAYTGVAPADMDSLDLYSCFPAAVRIQIAELDLAARGQLSTTGGMAFAGGPLNNYVLQSTVAVARALREQGAATGLVTCVSGMVTKQGAMVWTTNPPAPPFHSEDLSVRTAEAATTCEVTPDHKGVGVVDGYTVVEGASGPSKAIAIVAVPGGGRTVAMSEDMGVVAAFCTGEWVGRHVHVDGAELAL